MAELPAEVTRMLDEFVAAAHEAFGDQLQSVVLFGSAAEGALRATSDVNVILVLSAFERERADRFRETVEVAHAAVRLSAMFLLADEVAGAVEAFAQKFDDVRRRHRVLWGRDPFAALVPSRAALRRRLEQVLLNLALRLRAAYVERSRREEQLVPVIADAAAPLRTAAASLLELEGRPGVMPKAALRQVALGAGGPLAEAALVRMSQARETGALPAGVAGDTVLELIALAGALRTRLRALA